MLNKKGVTKVGDNVFKITPKIEELSQLCREDDLINPELYQKFDVKRGLRDRHN